MTTKTLAYDPTQFPTFAVTVDVVVLTATDEVLLVRRAVEPFAGMWALPGGFKRPNETLDDAARRELRQETGIDCVPTEFGVYGDPGRDPRTNVVTVAYVAHLREVDGIVPGADAASAVLLSVADVLNGTIELAFDHTRIVRDAVAAASPETHSLRPARVLATVLFTDIVDSTQTAAAAGDAQWRDVVAAYHARARIAFAAHRGREVDATGDGILATFEEPTRAVECALEIRSAMRDLGLEVRAGCHTGELEQTTDGVSGIAVHIGARVAALAGAGDVLVSQTVHDVTAGSGLVFADAGEHELKGVPGRWKVFRVE